MNKKLLRDGFEYYLEITAEGGEEYEYQMLLANHMETILPVNVTTLGEKRQLVYLASGYKTLDGCLEKMVINGEQILRIMDCVLKGIDEVRCYLLAPNNLVLSPDCLFVEADYSRTGLIYVPGYNQDIIVQLRELMEHLLTRIDSSDMASVMLAWKLHTLIKDEHISLKEMKKIMSGYREEGSLSSFSFTAAEMEKEDRNIKEAVSETQKVFSFFGVWKKSAALTISMILTGICFVLCFLVIILIYSGGILPWKRNLLLILVFLFVILVCITAALWKKDQMLSMLRALKGK